MNEKVTNLTSYPISQSEMRIFEKIRKLSKEDRDNCNKFIQIMNKCDENRNKEMKMMQKINMPVSFIRAAIFATNQQNNKTPLTGDKTAGA